MHNDSYEISLWTIRRIRICGRIKRIIQLKEIIKNLVVYIFIYINNRLLLRNKNH